MQRRLSDHPKHVWLSQSYALNLHKRKPPQAINRRSVACVFEKVGQSIAPKVALGTHSMRKTRAYAMHKAGRSIESIAKVLNHSSPSVTMRYIGLVQQDIDESYIDLNFKPDESSLKMKKEVSSPYRIVRDYSTKPR